MSDLSAGSKWKIYTHHGEIKFFLSNEFFLNALELAPGYLNPIQTQLAKHPWYYENYEPQSEKTIDVCNQIEKIDSSVSRFLIIQVEDYYCLLLDGRGKCGVNEYRMFSDQ